MYCNVLNLTLPYAPYRSGLYCSVMHGISLLLSHLSHPIAPIPSNPISTPCPLLGRHGEGPGDHNTGPPRSRGGEVPHSDVRDTQPPSELPSPQRSQAEKEIRRRKKKKKDDEEAVCTALIKHCLSVYLSICLSVCLSIWMFSPTPR
jgi:hypothetical protein